MPVAHAHTYGSGPSFLAEPLLEPLGDTLRDHGQRRTPADGKVAPTDRLDEFVRRLSVHEIAHERANRVDGLGTAEAEQQNAGA